MTIIPSNMSRSIVLKLVAKNLSAARSETAPFGTTSFWPLLEQPANWPVESPELAALLFLKTVYGVIISN